MASWMAIGGWRAEGEGGRGERGGREERGGGEGEGEGEGAERGGGRGGRRARKKLVSGVRYDCRYGSSSCGDSWKGSIYQRAGISMHISE